MASTFEHNEQTYQLPSFTPMDAFRLHDLALAAHRKAITDVACQLREHLTPEEFREQLHQARAEALAVVRCTPQQIEAYIGANIPEVLHLLLEREHPGEFGVADVMQLIVSGTLTTEHLAAIMAGAADE